MSLQSILDAIHASGQKQVCDIEASAHAQVQGILAEAEAEARCLRERSRALASAPATEEQARILHQAQIEALQIINDAREELVTVVLDRTRAQLAEIRTRCHYPALLCQLTKEAVAELIGSSEEDGKARLEVDSRDRLLITKTLSDLGLELPVSFGLECWGGLVCKSEDGRVAVSNTLEGRLARATPYLYSCLVALFESSIPFG